MGYIITPSVFVGLLMTLCGCALSTFAKAEDVTLTILHTNDVHSRFLQTNKFGGSCSEKDEKKNACYGGFARLHYIVREIRNSHRNVLYLSGGDYYQGTVWYTLYKWEVVSRFVNILNHTAMAIGNHEFDDNVAGLVPFLEAATFPIISCNIDDSKEPTMQGKYKKSIVVEVEGGRKVGIIGYTTEETADVSNPGNIVFKDVVEAIKEESERLYGQGVKVLIALGHAGYDVDQIIAKEVPLIDVVVGGHTNTFLYHGVPPDVEKPRGDYPTLITQESGRKVPVVQAYAFGKYLGYLNVNVDEEGEITSWNGNPLLLNASIPQDPALLQELQQWGKNVSELTKKQIGKTKVFLDGSTRTCRLTECNLGNLITDAMIYNNLKDADELHWNDVTIAIHNSGGIRGPIDEKANNGSITLDDILTVLPYQNTIDVIEIKGKHLREAFEFGVAGYDPNGHHLSGKFLQVSGIKIVYDMSQPDGSKVRTLQVLCNKCRVPAYVPLEDDKVYKVAVPTYIAYGGDGFAVIKNNKLSHLLTGVLDTDTLIEYIKSREPIIQGEEGRISLYEKSECNLQSIRVQSVNESSNRNSSYASAKTPSVTTLPIIPPA